MPKEYKSKWYKDNRDKILESRKIYYDSNKEKIQEYKKNWHFENRNEILNKKKEYSKKNRAHKNAKNAQYRAYKGKATPKWANLEELIKFIKPLDN